MFKRIALALILGIIVLAGLPGMVTPASAASSSQKNVCVYYYGGWSSSVRDRIIATKPAFLVLDSSAGSYGGGPSAGDVALVQANGTKVFAYIFTGGMRGFLWDPTDTSAPSNSYSAVIGFVDRVKSYGYAGVYFDEGGLYSPVSGQTYQNSILDRYLASPGGITGNSKYDFAMGETWKGKTVESYLGYAKSLGLLVCEGMDSYSSSNVKENIWPILDFVLTQENYSGSAPAGVEIAHASQCWVLSYNGAFSATNTNKAIGYGFGAAYDCASMGTLSSPAYENYITAIVGTSSPPPPTTTTPPAATTPPPTTTTPPPTTPPATTTPPAATTPPPTTTSPPATKPPPATIKAYTLIVGVQGQGSVYNNGVLLLPGTYQIPANQLVNLTATPAIGYKFRTWTWPSNWKKNPGYAGWTENPTSWKMFEPISIIAVFNKIA